MKYIGENAIKKLISLIKGDLATKQPTITASGLLKGDGAGTVTAADTQEATLVDVPNGLLKGDGTTISAAVAEMDYMVPPTGGTTGQVLKKTETGTEWADESCADKQDKLTGTAGQMVGFDENGNAVAQELPSSGMSETDADAKYLQLSGGTMNGQLTMNSRLCVMDGQRLDINKAGVGSTITLTGDTAQFLNNVNVDIFKTPTDNVHAANKAYVDSKVPKSVAVTLYADMWAEDASGRYSQTVSVTGVLADETAQLIQSTPALASQTAYYEAGILCSGQAADSLTFTARAAPTENLKVYVVIQDVVPPPPVTLISFTIDGTTYQAEEGMTVGQWLGSSYNTGGFSKLYDPAGAVSNDSIIQPNYYFSSSSGNLGN